METKEIEELVKGAKPFYEGEKNGFQHFSSGIPSDVMVSISLLGKRDYKKFVSLLKNS